ncbi:MAG: MerR family transcriptional regulator [Candidatus Aminicenantes bacterium]|nr:MerR family transcriptional regulator [Candidatus Aminicenantes bacterium]
MGKTIFIKGELMEEAVINAKTLEEWEKLQLLKPDGLTKAQVPFYSKDTLERIKHIKGLLELGYEIKDIHKIIKKVGVPKTFPNQNKKTKLNKYLSVGDLADRVGVSPRAIKHWEDKGIIEPDMRSEGGFRLYSDIYVYLCNLIKDLQLFGYTLEEIKEISDLFRYFLTIKNDLKAYSKEENTKTLDTMLEHIQTLFERMKLMREGMERWEKLLKSKKKEVTDFKDRNLKRSESKGTAKNE